MPASRARPFPEEHQVLSWKSTQGELKPEPQVGQGQGVVSKARAQEGLSLANFTPPTPKQHSLILQLKGPPFKGMGALSLTCLLSPTTTPFSSQQPQENLSDTHFAISPKKKSTLLLKKMRQQVQNGITCVKAPC